MIRDEWRNECDEYHSSSQSSDSEKSGDDQEEIKSGGFQRKNKENKN